MPHKRRKTRRTSMVLLLATVVIGTASDHALARGSGGGSGSGGGYSHGSAQPHPNSEAAANANGRFSEDKQTGLDRAQERRSPQGARHEQATTKAPAGDALDGKKSDTPLQQPTPTTK